MKADVTLVTYAGLPDLSPDDRLLKCALEDRGLIVRAAIWSDEKIDWAAARLTIIRSTWDYFFFPQAFLKWVSSIEDKTSLLNSADVIRWNHHKRYLEDLDARGVAIVPTRFLSRGAAPDHCLEAIVAYGDDIVIKPAISGSAHGARRFSVAREAPQAVAHAMALLTQGDVMIQPFQEAVLSERERSLIFVDQEYSHAYLKSPFSAGTAGGKAGEDPYEASPAEVAFAEGVLEAAGRGTAYARVDMIPGPLSPLLMELELIEPALHFHLSPQSAGRFADAIVRRCSEACVRSPDAACLGKQPAIHEEEEVVFDA